MEKIMLEGLLVRLRPWCEADLSLMSSLRNDISVQAQLMARPRGSTQEQIKQWLTGFENDPQSILLIVARLKDDQPVGFIQVKQIDTLNRRAQIGIALKADHAGQGLGSEATYLLLAYLKKNWNLRKLMLQVRGDNKRAQAAYSKVGFQSCGVFKEHVFIDGEWQDVVNMEVLL
jgi:diamine N-acetyltransferase